MQSDIRTLQPQLQSGVGGLARTPVLGLHGLLAAMPVLGLPDVLGFVGTCADVGARSEMRWVHVGKHTVRSREWLDWEACKHAEPDRGSAVSAQLRLQRVGLASRRCGARLRTHASKNF